MRKKVLFVCKYNHNRSQVSAFLFNTLYRGKKWEADSAGVIGGVATKPVRENLALLKKRHNMTFTRQKTLTKKLIYNCDIIIVVADDVPIELFSTQKDQGIKVIQWKIKDDWKHKNIASSIERSEKVYHEIEERIKQFVKKLE